MRLWLNFLGKGLRTLLEKEMTLISIATMAIEIIIPGISGPKVLDVEADGLNCSLTNLSQLMMIMLCQEIFEAENVFEKPEA